MENNTTIDGNHFTVLKNNEGQYSIWPSGKIAPDGWLEAGFSGSKSECSKYIDENWIDMRPASLVSKLH
ncbi:MAG: MbtH family NRPS accessory protein [Polynucleobacter sp.]|uniref:MbtH family protein n=1 Tax=Polynucleobacter sp. TaxID=2029855 RepID=UPI00216E2FE8|nr:MbtH family NRPS accessory protein [Polynucleobacter sp.]MBU3669355.1 MbtH family NRPS accessory protein [Polynucleobacter sp.]